MEMGGTGSPSQTNTESEMKTKTYAQAAAQTLAEKREEKEQGKGKGKARGPNTPAEKSGDSGGAASPLQRFPFVEDLSKYEEKETEGMMAKAVVIHGVPTNWRINGVADCAGRIMGEVIGVRWLLGERRKKPHRWSFTWRMKSSWSQRLV